LHLDGIEIDIEVTVNRSNRDFFGELNFSGEEGGCKPGELLGGIGAGEADLGFYVF